MVEIYGFNFHKVNKNMFSEFNKDLSWIVVVESRTQMQTGTFDNVEIFVK